MSLLDHLDQKHKGKSFAVLGSAPSLEQFNRQQDVTIGVNGTAILLKKGDYFLSADSRVFSRSWFKALDPEVTCIIRPMVALQTDRFLDKAQRSDLLTEYNSLAAKYPEHLVPEYDFPFVTPGVEEVDNWMKQFPAINAPHQVIRHFTSDVDITKADEVYFGDGTSSCFALQTAYLMGAEEIHLYGVEFSNFPKTADPLSGDNYFYKPQKGELGRTLDSQLEIMDEVARQIIEQGVPVYSHGATRLANTIKANHSD